MIALFAAERLIDLVLGVDVAADVVVQEMA